MESSYSSNTTSTTEAVQRRTKLNVKHNHRHTTQSLRKNYPWRRSWLSRLGTLRTGWEMSEVLLDCRLH